MRLDDYCCLGRTVPEDSKKYGKRVCSAGYSEELRSFVRIYPLPVQNPIKQRHVCTLELERNSQDSRIESWRLARERQDDGIVEVSNHPRDMSKVIAWLETHTAPSISWLNERRLSIGVIKPAGIRGKFRDRQTGDTVDPDQRLLFEDLDESFPDGPRINRAPYLCFADEAGRHELQLREWGCYEWIRKQPDRLSQLWDNLRLTSRQDFFLVVGNMCNRRNAWLVISVYSQDSAGPLFSGAK